MVMELCKAQLEGETPVTGVEGKLVKGNLAKVFVMGKGDGWGRACHAPLAQKNFVHRYGEYFDTRKGM